MLFTWAINTSQRWLHKPIYRAQAPIAASLAFGLAVAVRALASWLIDASASPLATRSFAFLEPFFFYIGTASLSFILLDKLFRYRTGHLLLASLSLCAEDVCASDLDLRRGQLIVELRMGEFYNFAKYWRLKLTPKELVPFVYLDTYRGILLLIEQVKDGTAPINESTPLMTTTIFLRALNQIPSAVVTEEITPDKTLVYRLAMALSLRMNPFSSRLPAPRSGSKRAYLLTKSLLDNESFFREEVARLSSLTERILRRKYDSSRDR